MNKKWKITFVTELMKISKMYAQKICHTTNTYELCDLVADCWLSYP